MGSRQGADIKYRFRLLFFFLLLFDTLLGLHVLLQDIHIEHSHIREVLHTGEVLQVQHIPDLRIIHRVKGLLHAVPADTDPARQTDHLSGLTFGAMTQKAHLLVLVFLVCPVRIVFLFPGFFRSVFLVH